jgi:hypothetical protein
MEEINKILYQGYVVDSDDPLRLGRLRVIPDSENVEDIKSTVTQACKDETDVVTGVKRKCKWTKDDPFTIIPLLPYSLNITPKENELVHIIYPVVQNAKSQSRKYSDRNRFYIPAIPSTPLAFAYEDNTASKVHLPFGDNIKQAKNLKEVGGRIQSKSYGIFPEPEDNAMLGRGSADIILKNDTALIRAGKSKNLVGPTNSLPTENEKRAFLQLTDFTTNQEKGPQKTTTVIDTEFKQLILLIEWHISNPENEVDIFSGYINLYNVQTKKDEKLNTKNFKVDTDVENLKGSQLPISINFFGKSYEEVLNIFNSFIDGLNNGEIFVEGYTQVPFVPERGKQFPFAFRPSPPTYKRMVSNQNPIETNNLTKFYLNIGLSKGSPKKGFGIVTSKGSTDTPLIVKSQTYDTKTSGQQGISYGIVGAQKIYLFSHDSQIGVKKPSLQNTIYGLDQNKFLELDSSTDSMVRGEKLMDLLSLIVRFLTSHCHDSGIPAIPVAVDGTTSAQILQKMADAPNTILNTKIRIN